MFKGYVVGCGICRHSPRLTGPPSQIQNSAAAAPGPPSPSYSGTNTQLCGIHHPNRKSGGNQILGWKVAAHCGSSG